MQCALCEQIKPSESIPESICDECKKIKRDFYMSMQFALGEVDSHARTIYPIRVLLKIAQEALDELKQDYA